jgi:DNA-directed RNA polymerase subunit RPC12/RpoP
VSREELLERGAHARVSVDDQDSPSFHPHKAYPVGAPPGTVRLQATTRVYSVSASIARRRDDETRMDRNDTKERVDVLRCPACGADVALADEDLATCAHCGAKVPIPEAHRELHRLARSEEIARARAASLLPKLDSAPWLVTRIVAAIFDQSAFGFLVFFGAPAIAACILVSVAANAPIARLMGLANPDDVPFAITTTIAIFTFFPIAFVPRALGVYASRRAAARARLTAGFMAAPPKTAGGPATCRSCGAPLSIAAGTPVAHCAYCGADNAVTIENAFLRRLAETVGGERRTIHDAIAMDANERRETRRTLVRELVRYLAWTTGFAILSAMYVWGLGPGSGPLQQIVGGIAMVTLALGLVALIVVGLIRAAVKTPAKAANGVAEAAAQRRRDIDVPPWVRVVGPIGLWVAFYIIRSLVP